MKKLLIILFLLTGCDLFAQEHQYQLIWDYNDPIEQVTEYNLFIVELTDTLQTPFIEGMNPDSVRSYQVATILESELQQSYPDSAVWEFSSIQNGKYLQAGATAVNEYAESDLAVSGFLKKQYKIKPSLVEILRIEE